MVGRRFILVALALLASFGSGAALAATHGSGHPARRPQAKVSSFSVTANVHYPCRKHGSPTALL
jgi:hypothetical protein